MRSQYTPSISTAPPAAFHLKSNLAIECHGSRVVLPHLQLHPRQTKRTRSLDGLTDEPLADTPSPLRRQDAHSEHAGMPRRRPVCSWRYITPADDAITFQRHKMRMAVRDALVDEIARELDRRCFKEGQVGAFSGYRIERGMK